MSTVFISHSGDDGRLALEIALDLEEHGYSTWCYEVDSVPGVSYLVQTGEAVERAAVVVVVISRRSLTSHQITREVERAHESGKHFIPLLVDLTHPEFQAAQPTWRQALGTATSLPVTAGDRRATSARIASGLLGLGIAPDRSPNAERLTRIQAALASLPHSGAAGPAAATPLRKPAVSDRPRSARLPMMLGAIAAGGALVGLWLWRGPRPPAAGDAPDDTAVWENPFRNKRPAGRAPPREAAYALKTEPVATEPGGGAGGAVAQEVGVIGITLFRLRRAGQGDDERIRVLVHDDATSPPGHWTPVRVEADAEFAEGDRVRLAIETPWTGYLYVVDREQRADGSLGPPYLIFPTLRTRGGDNATLAGRLLEIPAWDDTPPYFTLTRSGPSHVGEVLTVFLSIHPLPDMAVGREALTLAGGLIDEWQSRWGRPVERLELVGGAGRPYTLAEREAGGDGARLLTQEEPLPQSLYRIRAARGDPLLVTVPLRIRP